MDLARELQRWQFEEGNDTNPGRQGGENVETLGNTSGKMTKALDDIMPSRSEGPDTWYQAGRGER